MTISPAVAKAVDQIRKDKDLIASMRKADDLRDKQLAELQAKVADLTDESKLSDEDRKALTDAVDEMRDTHEELATAVPANTEPVASDASQGGPVAPTPLEYNPDADRPDPLPGTGQNGSVPLMPNSAFDPDPTGARGAGDAGQPPQARAIETAGGFVVSGGGSVQRAPGSDPASPSSTLVAPTDPDAKAAANNADLIKSGLGDSSQNALLGNDGQPISEGPGIVTEPSPAAAEAAQKQQDAINEEKARREENPLNLAPAGTPQAGSAEALAQPKGIAEKAKSDEDHGVPANSAAPGSPPTPGPDGDMNQRAPV